MASTTRKSHTTAITAASQHRQQDVRRYATPAQYDPEYNPVALPSVIPPSSSGDMAETSSITTYSPSSSDDDESDTSTLQPSQTPAPSYPSSLLPPYTPNYKGTYATKEDYLTALRAWAKEKEYMKPSEGFGNLQGFYGDMNSEDYIKRADDRRRIGRGTQSSISNREDVASSAGLEIGRRKSRTLFGRRRTSRAEGEGLLEQGSVAPDADSVAELNVAPDKGTQTTSADRPVSAQASETANRGRRPSWFKRRWNDYKGMVDEEEKMPEI